MSFKDKVDVVSSIVGTLAILVGAWWTWLLFVRQRQGHMKAVVAHATDAHVLDGNNRRIRVDIKVKNVGSVALRPAKVRTSIQQVMPLAPELAAKLAAGQPILEEEEIPWPVLAVHDRSLADEDLVIEPGEEEHLYCDFVIPGKVALAELHTMVFADSSENAQFWEGEILVDVAAKPAAGATPREPGPAGTAP